MINDMPLKQMTQSPLSDEQKGRIAPLFDKFISEIMAIDEIAKIGDEVVNDIMTYSAAYDFDGIKDCMNVVEEKANATENRRCVDRCSRARKLLDEICAIAEGSIDA